MKDESNYPIIRYSISAKIRDTNVVAMIKDIDTATEAERIAQRLKTTNFFGQFTVRKTTKLNEHSLWRVQRVLLDI